LPDLAGMETNESTGTRKASAAQPAPVFIRTTDIQGRYGLKRSFVYQLIREGRLKSFSLKGRGKVRGIRLFRPEDIEKAISDLSEGGQP
jgi:hypothetical protein